MDKKFYLEFDLPQSKKHYINFLLKDDKPPEEILERLKKADLNRDNIISYSEFRRMLYDDRKVMPKKEATAMVRIFKYAVLVSTASDNQENYFRILGLT